MSRLVRRIAEEIIEEERPSNTQFRNTRTDDMYID
jgi:hypothetical protein